MTSQNLKWENLVGLEPFYSLKFKSRVQPEQLLLIFNVLPVKLHGTKEMCALLPVYLIYCFV